MACRPHRLLGARTRPPWMPRPFCAAHSCRVHALYYAEKVSSQVGQLLCREQPIGMSHHATPDLGYLATCPTLHSRPPSPMHHFHCCLQPLTPMLHLSDMGMSVPGCVCMCILPLLCVVEVGRAYGCVCAGSCRQGTWAGMWHTTCAHYLDTQTIMGGPGCRYNEVVARVLVALVHTADDLIDEYAKFKGPQPRPVPGATRDAELAAGIPYMLRSRCVRSVPDE